MNRCFMHKLNQLEKIIEERISSLQEEVEIATNVKLNPIYISDRRDEIQFLRWTTRALKSILSRDDEEQLAITKERLELTNTIEFENYLYPEPFTLYLIPLGIRLQSYQF